VDPPRSIAVRAITGMTAPLPISYTVAGRKTEAVTDRSVGSDGLVTVVILGKR
jgi:hypothetical protein